MAIQNATREARATGTGSATTFSFSPVILLASASELTVYTLNAQENETLVPASDYTVAVNEFPGTGSITFDTAPADGTVIVMRRTLEVTQLTRLFNQGAFDPAVIERALDKLTLLITQAGEDSGDGLTEDEVDVIVAAAVASYQTAPQVAVAIAAAVVNFRTEAQINTLISTAIAGLSSGSTAPTLANVVSALGLGAVAAANREQFIKRKDDDTGFEYVDAPSGTDPGASHDLQILDAKTQDLYAAVAPADYVPVTTPATQGGTGAPKASAYTLQQAIAVTAWEASQDLTETPHIRYIPIRTPSNVDHRAYVVNVTTADVSMGRSYDINLSTRTPLGTQGSWTYWSFAVPSWTGLMLLERASNAASVGASHYDGGVARGKVLDALGIPAYTSGNRLQMLRRKSDDTGFDFIDEPSGGTGGADATARAAATANKRESDRNTRDIATLKRETSRVGFDHVLRALVAGDNVRIAVVTPAQWAAGGIAYGTAFGLTATYPAQGNYYWLAAVGPDVDLAAMEFGNPAHFAHGTQFTVAADAKITGLPNGWAAWGYTFHGPAVSVPAGIFGDQDYTVSGNIHADIPKWEGKLDTKSALDALGLPALASANRGQIIERKSDDTGFQFVNKPTGGGGGADTGVTYTPEGDPLPSTGTFADDHAILHEGEFYHKTSVANAGYAFRFRSGHTTVGAASIRGVERGVTGQFLVNPNNNFQEFADDGSVIQLFVSRTAYRAAKGSNERSGDTLSATISTEESAVRTQTLTLTYGGVSITTQEGVDFLSFQGPRASTILDAALDGDVAAVALTRGGSAFMNAPGNHEVWVPLDLVQAKRNAALIRRQSEQITRQFNQLDELLTDLHLGSMINTSAWAADTTAGNGVQRATAAWSLQSAQAASPGAWLKSTLGERAGGEHVAVRIVHTLDPRLYRARIERHDGIRDHIMLSQLWNLGNGTSLGVSYTYFAKPDFVIYPGEYVVLEKAGASSHVGQTEFAGNLDAGKVSGALIELVADEAAYDALSSPDATKLYLW